MLKKKMNWKQELMNTHFLWATLFKRVMPSYKVCKHLLVGALLLPQVLMASISYETYIKNKYESCQRKAIKIFLKGEQKKQILVKTNLDDMSSLMLKYEIKCAKETIFAYIDTHQVRTLNETIIIELKNKKVKHIEITNFMEPQEYQVPESWLSQFVNRGDSFKMGQNIDGLTGATLSSHAVTNAVQKIMTTEKMISEK